MSSRLGSANGSKYAAKKLLLPLYNSGKDKNEGLHSIKYNKRYVSKLFKKQKNVLIYVYLLVISVWMYTITYYEVNYVNRTMEKCNNKDLNKDDVNILVYGDVQIMDKHSYPDRPAAVNWLTRVILDRYHIKNWKASQKIIKPDYNLFMGDLFDGGRYWDNDYWYDEFDRFHEIFYQINKGSKNILNLPGNHDIGFGETIVKESFERFNQNFGPTNARIQIQNTNTVIYIIDTIALSDTASPEIQGNVLDYLKEIKNHHLKSENENRILVTHVPLYRDPNVQTCGSHRESKKPFPIMKGDQYQTVISPELSQLVLNSVQPALVLSGDDHDYCEIEHTYNDGLNTVTEITTKSAAMNMGINKPELTYLSVSPQNDLSYRQCALPNPYKPILVYIFLLVVSVTWIGYVTFFDNPFDGGNTENTQKQDSLLIYGDKKKMQKLFADRKLRLGVFLYRVAVISAVTIYFYI